MRRKENDVILDPSFDLSRAVLKASSWKTKPQVRYLVDYLP